MAELWERPVDEGNSLVCCRAVIRLLQTTPQQTATYLGLSATPAADRTLPLSSSCCSTTQTRWAISSDLPGRRCRLSTHGLPERTALSSGARRGRRAQAPPRARPSRQPAPAAACACACTPRRPADVSVSCTQAQRHITVYAEQRELSWSKKGLAAHIDAIAICIRCIGHSWSSRL